MQLLTLQDFAACANEVFSAELNDGAIEFTLVEAAPINGGPPNPLRQAFSLLFRNTSPLLFPQQSYRMCHPRMGDVHIFLVPIARDREGFLYQAVFN